MDHASQSGLEGKTDRMAAAVPATVHLEIQDARPHPIFDHASDALCFNSDEGRTCAEYRRDVSAFLSMQENVSDHR